MTNLAINLRPRSFDKIYNQDNIIKELKIRAKKKDWPNAMLMKGASGTGKSSVAQIVAMTINCSNLQESGDPCCVCDSCRSIMEERFDRDTIVLDGSTIGQKDEIVSFGNLADMSPMYDKKKVLIIEESDQLSAAAKNALHKILEKPRNHVHFILLSMVASGLPPSIQSRCQTYNFSAFSLKETAIGLKNIMVEQELWDSTDIPDSFKLEGLMTLASASRGSFREAIQYLEKCLTGQFYTKEEIRKNLGIIDNSTVNELLDKLFKRDPKFFEMFNTIDFNEFFNLGYYTLSNAYVYLISGYIEDEWMGDVIKGLSKDPKLRECLMLFDDLYRESKPYIKKAYMMSRLAQFFTKNGSIPITSPANQKELSDLGTRVALHTAQKEALEISSRNVETPHINDTNLSTRAVRVPRSN